MLEVSGVHCLKLELVPNDCYCESQEGNLVGSIDI
jgi:hypothetical protein